MNKILVFLYPGCAEFEVTVACWQIAESSKYEINTITYDFEAFSTGSDFIVVGEKLVSDFHHIDDVAGIIIPGGSLLDLRVELQILIQNLNQNEKMIAAICAGPQYLATTGILDSKRFTTSRTPDSYFELNQPDPFNWSNYMDTRVVVDGNIITSQGYAFSDFAIAIWEHLGLISTIEEKTEWTSRFFPDIQN
jgi:putative intracellular protease/amidase